jgi:hypothetical protein
VTERCWSYWNRRGVKKKRRAEGSPKQPREAIAPAPHDRELILRDVRRESDLALVDLIRRRLALPVSQRMNFLRVRVPGGGSHL